jgi:RNAse (barnase) inhibitor barstar
VIDVDDDFLDSWVDVAEIFPGLGAEPFFVTGGRRDDLADRLRQAGFEVVEVDLSGSRNDEDFVAKFGRAIGAPSYFGENWDALNDVLRDRASGGTWKIALIVLGSREFAARNLHDYARMVSILRAMSERMSNIDAPVGQLEIFYIDEQAFS